MATVVYIVDMHGVQCTHEQQIYIHTQLLENTMNEFVAT